MNHHPKEIVTHAPMINSARYSFETQEQGDYWKGRCIISFGTTQITGEAMMRSPERAIAAAIQKAARCVMDLEQFKREGGRDK